MNPPATSSRLRSLSVFRAELKESFLMAMSALAAHKLRSALTLLGVMVGVFSIIVVMTTMRAMQSHIEADLGQLGGQSFVVQKWPGVYFGGPDGFEKYWRRKDITLHQGLQVRSRLSLARTVGLELWFPSGDMNSRYAKAPPGANLA